MKYNRFIQKREELHLTQKQVAEMIHISQPMLCRVEAGNRSLDDANKMKLAKLYNVTVEWLFFENNYD
jgi:putative transcriptional regulator